MASSLPNSNAYTQANNNVVNKTVLHYATIDACVYVVLFSRVWTKSPLYTLLIAPIAGLRKRTMTYKRVGLSTRRRRCLET